MHMENMENLEDHLENKILELFPAKCCNHSVARADVSAVWTVPTVLTDYQ